VQLFPERDGRRRRFLFRALVLSLAVHLVGSLLWPFVARTFLHEVPPERVVAQIELITIERRPPPTPTPTPTPPPQRPRIAQGRPVPAPRKPARVAAPPLAAIPKLALPTYAPQAEPVARPRRATIHIPPSRAVAQVPVPRGAAGAATGGALDVAALDATFRKTIDQAQRDAAAAPQAERAAPVHTMKRYAKVLDGSVTEVLASDGVCDPLDDGTVRGPYTYYYLRCTVHFTDGFSEIVSFPWPYKFTRRNDPFAYHDGRPHEFPSQAPPDGFVLPHPFALSRTICAFYRDDCIAVIKREQDNGNNAP
jgi:hypothetical protein